MIGKAGVHDSIVTGPRYSWQGHEHPAQQENALTPPPLPGRAALEWRLARSAWVARAIDHGLHRPRRAWHAWRWRRRQAREPAALWRFESTRYSQAGEDGIIAEIFRRVGDGGRFAVEFGIGDGRECCTRRLIVDGGWRALLIDADPGLIERARRLYAGVATVRIICGRVTVDNVLDLFRDGGVPSEPDLLVIDVDGNDYWVWERILSVHRPRVVVIEYNARWVPPARWIMPYDPDHRWDGSAYFGASLASLADLGARHGYALVGCNSSGVNAFFVRDDVRGDRFPDQGRGTAHHYAPPRFGKGFGHSVRPRGRLQWAMAIMNRPLLLLVLLVLGGCQTMASVPPGAAPAPAASGRGTNAYGMPQP